LNEGLSNSLLPKKPTEKNAPLGATHMLEQLANLLSNWQKDKHRTGSTWTSIRHIGLPEVELPGEADAGLEPPPVVGKPPSVLDMFGIEILERLALGRDRLGVELVWAGSKMMAAMSGNWRDRSPWDRNGGQ
jgi:hypothetical protein